MANEPREASVLVHWPGKSTPACYEHKGKLEALARFMGFAVVSTPCETRELCANCVNEAKKEVGR